MENSLKILLVEDVKIAQKMAVMTLNKLKTKVDIAENGCEAIQKFSENEYDLVLMDLGLPDTDGLELTERLKKINRSNNSVPIVALTAHGEEDVKAKCFSAGMIDFITKPLTIERIQFVINSLFHNPA